MGWEQYILQLPLMFWQKKKNINGVHIPWLRGHTRHQPRDQLA